MLLIVTGTETWTNGLFPKKTMHQIQPILLLAVSRSSVEPEQRQTPISPIVLVPVPVLVLALDTASVITPLPWNPLTVLLLCFQGVHPTVRRPSGQDKRRDHPDGREE